MKTKAVKDALPANRVAALATMFAGIAAVISAAAGAFPSGVATKAAVIAGFFGTYAGPLAHIVGSWIWQKTPAGQAKYLPAAVTSPSPVGALPFFGDIAPGAGEAPPPEFTEPETEFTEEYFAEPEEPGLGLDRIEVADEPTAPGRHGPYDEPPDAAEQVS